MTVYTCPQCGPDPTGAEEHARKFHTVAGLLEQAAKGPVDYVAAMKQLRDERIAHMSLVVERRGRCEYDLVKWIEDDGMPETLEIPKGLDVYGALRCVDILDLRVQRAKEDGRFELQKELLDLLGAQRHES